ncbi:MAG: XRE family transcriptional regulator, partial [Hungatella hathewayi]
YHSCGDVSELHGDTFFDEVEGWLEETVMSSGLMRSQRAVQKNAVNGMLEEPEFDSLRELPGFQEILRQLKS